MFYAYILRSEMDNSQSYIGFTSDLKARLKQHNGGASPHTAKYRPWKIHAYFAFDQESQARAFEQYLKTGSGRAFAKRHFPLQ